MITRKIKKKRIIEQAVKTGLCTGCGTCAGICPESAITMEINEKKGIYLPKVDKDKCNQCGICLNLCPGHSVDFDELNKLIFGKIPEDFYLGNYEKCYVGHAVDEKIRYNSSSGGLITALLLFMLEEGIIDGALVTRMNKKNPLEPEPFIARSREGIIAASKSKYCPVPANIALREILESDGKFAVVGLPCHIHGIRKAESLNKNLKQKIAFHLGMFCNHTPNLFGTELLLKRLKVKRDEVTKLDYRGGGWPGYMNITKKGENLLLELPDYWAFVGLDFFFPIRCLVCSDQTSELADISFGDAWLPGLTDKIGKSIIIARTGNAEQLLQHGKNKSLLELVKCRAIEVKQSQISMLYFKKKSLKARVKILRKRMPFNGHLFKPDILDYPLSLFSCINHLISQNRVLRLVLDYIPDNFLSLYKKPFDLLYYRKVSKWMLYD